MTKPEWFTYESVIASIREFLLHASLPAGKKFALVMDNAPWHKKAYRLIKTEAQPEYNDIRSKVELIKLPPYSPDLNPIEQCWRITRREVTHNHYFPQLPDLEMALDNFFQTFKNPNNKLKSLCSFINN